MARARRSMVEATPAAPGPAARPTPVIRPAAPEPAARRPAARPRAARPRAVTRTAAATPAVMGVKPRQGRQPAATVPALPAAMPVVARARAVTAVTVATAASAGSAKVATRPVATAATRTPLLRL